jgi:hypothetical protein
VSKSYTLAFVHDEQSAASISNTVAFLLLFSDSVKKTPPTQEAFHVDNSILSNNPDASSPGNPEVQAFFCPEEAKDACIREFENRMGDLTHKRCDVCHRVSLNLRLLKARQLEGISRCVDCSGKTEADLLKDHMLPVWYDRSNQVQYTVPKALSILREGEKLLIQMVSPYVPLVHIKNGTCGIKGHVCSFPQRVSDVITTLPRLPDDVKLVKMVRNFRKKDGETGTKAFVIRRPVVMNALYWLVQHNRVYREEVTINLSNMEWMGDNDEMELPDIDLDQANENGVAESAGQEENPDLGPSPNQTQPPIDGIHEQITTCAVHVTDSLPFKSDEDKAISKELQELTKASGGTNGSLRRLPWPHVGEEMIDEYDKIGRIFCKAFPWLFPGGEGDICDYHEGDMTVADWVSRLLYYEDGRFARDKMWSFFALNFMTRRRNQTQGRFFVDNFYKDSPETLDELKTRIREGDTSYIDRISYFSNKVRGSAAFWRAKRAELYSWINYHVNEGHGAPTYFITLSCAEYHWPDIRRLLEDRMSHYPASTPSSTATHLARTWSGLSAEDLNTAEQHYYTYYVSVRNPDTAKAPPKDSEINDKQNIVKLADDLCIVIQEFFQLRVKAFLETVGRDILGIKYHWLRYEFAPSRGQVHAHMLAIADPKVQSFFKAVHNKRDDPKKQAEMLEKWSGDLMRLSANVDTNLVKEENISKMNNPCQKRYSDVNDHAIDENELLMFTQNHVCSDKYCMRSKDNKGYVHFACNAVVSEFLPDHTQAHLRIDVIKNNSFQEES